MNDVTLIGRTGKDPEIKHTNSGTSIVNVSLVTSRKYKDRNGNTQEKSAWHNLIIFGKSADIFARYVKKGHRVMVKGEIDYQSWEAQDGSKRYKTVINVQGFEFLESKKDSSNDGGWGNDNNSQYNQRNNNSQPSGGYDSNYGQPVVNDDDLPF